MSVLVEATTVVIPVEVIEGKLGGLAAFAQNAPNRTFRSDGRLAAIGFMHPDDVDVFILSLESDGLAYVRNGTSVDIAVIDQFHGLAFPCSWLSLGTDAHGVKYVTLAGEDHGEIATHPGWRPESAMVRLNTAETTIDPETGLEYLLDKRGRKLYSGRRFSAGDPHAALMWARPKLMSEACKAAEEALIARGWQEFSTHSGVDPLCHLVMHLKNQLALVYVEVVWTSTTINPFTAERRARLLAEASARHAMAVHVVCKLFAAIWMKSVGEQQEPTADGWTTINIPQDGLRVDAPRIEGMVIKDTATNRTLDERRLDMRRPIEISDWELNEFAVYLVSEKLKEEGYELGGCTTAPGSEPNIVAKRGDKRIRVVVGAGRYPNIDPIIDKNRLLAACERGLGDGAATAVAKVSVASAEDQFVSKEMRPLLRGSRFVSRFKGLETVNPVDVINARYVRIFVSSTFRDFERERETLAKIVLPELKRRAGARGVDVSLVDLRWGVPKADVEEEKEVAACLREIDKAHPFFLLMLGERYGATRDTDQLKDLLETSPWLIDARDSISITELELRYAMLKPTSFNASALVFIRTAKKLWGGKRELLAAPFRRARAALLERGYRSNPIDSDFAAHATEQLWSLIDRHYPAEETRAPGLAAGRRHKLFGLRVSLFLPAEYMPENLASGASGTIRVLNCRSSWEAQALAARLAVQRESTAISFAYHCALDPSLENLGHRLMEFAEITTGEAVSSGRVDDPGLIGRLIDRLNNWAADEARSISIAVSETDLLDGHEGAVLQALQGKSHVEVTATRVHTPETGTQRESVTMFEWPPAVLEGFLRHYLAAHGKALDHEHTEAVVRHPLAGDLSFLRFYCDHLLSAATHHTLELETARLLRCETFADLSGVFAARIEAMCEPDDDWRVALRTLPASGASEEDWRQRSKLNPMSFARAQAALNPMLESWGDWRRPIRGENWSALAAALQ